MDFVDEHSDVATLRGFSQFPLHCDELTYVSILLLCIKNMLMCCFHFVELYEVFVGGVCAFFEFK